MTHNPATPWLLCAKYCSPYLALAVFDGARLVEVTSHRLVSGGRAIEQLHSLMGQRAIDYAPDCIVIEPTQALYMAATATGIPVTAMTLGDAKRQLLGAVPAASNRDLYRFLVARFPDLRRLVTILRASGEIAQSEPWRTVELLPVALGLAALNRVATSTSQ